MSAYFDLLERAVITAVQCFAALLVADSSGLLYSIDALEAAACAGMAAGLSVVKSFAASKLVGDSSPSLVK